MAGTASFIYLKMARETEQFNRRFRTNCAGRSNTSSIMLRNAPSIMRGEEAGATAG
jgi:hypothetical protein